MTQKTSSVSPLIPACPKPGATAPAFRPADPGDTAAPFFHGRSVHFAGRPVSRPSPVRPCLATLYLFPLCALSALFGAVPQNQNFLPSSPILPVARKSEIRQSEIRNPDPHFTRMVPHYFAPYRETKFFCKPQN